MTLEKLLNLACLFAAVKYPMIDIKVPVDCRNSEYMRDSQADYFMMLII